MDLERGTTTRMSLTNFTKKFSFRSREYAKVDDMYDTRIPLHNEEAFQHGLKFKAKYIGSLEIARPTCKLDIIHAMRRIRYEYKVKGIRKKRVTLEVSTQGVTINKRKRRRRRKQYTEDQLRLMRHPIYRIFYVSHDSQDLKIFSYITREVPDNTFKCNVFKAYKKGMALHVVRSLGQAFDVCHKLNPKASKDKSKAKKEDTEGGGKDGKEEGENGKETEGEPAKPAEVNTDIDVAMHKLNLDNGTSQQADVSKDLMELHFDPFTTSPATASANPNQGTAVPNGTPLASLDPFQSPYFVTSMPNPPLTMNNTSTSLPDFPVSADKTQTGEIPLPPTHHLAYISRPRPRPSVTQQNVITENPFTDVATGSESPDISIGEPLGADWRDDRRRKESNPFKSMDPNAPDMWELEKQQLTAHMTLLREQLKAETAARIESQARVEHLLMQNKELLTHLQKLMVQLQQIQSLQLPALAATTNTNMVTSPPPATTTSSITAVSPPLDSTDGHPGSSIDGHPESSVDELLESSVDGPPESSVSPEVFNDGPLLPAQAPIESPVDEPKVESPENVATESPEPPTDALVSLEEGTAEPSASETDKLLETEQKAPFTVEPNPSPTEQSDPDLPATEQHDPFATEQNDPFATDQDSTKTTSVEETPPTTKVAFPVVFD